MPEPAGEDTLLERLCRASWALGRALGEFRRYAVPPSGCVPIRDVQRLLVIPVRKALEALNRQ
jgi:hypothetical protein